MGFGESLAGIGIYLTVFSDPDVRGRGPLFILPYALLGLALSLAARSGRWLEY